MHAGAIDLIAKPIDYDSLSKVLNKHFLLDYFECSTEEPSTVNHIEPKVKTVFKVDPSNIGTGGAYLPYQKEFDTLSPDESIHIDLKATPTQGNAPSLGIIEWVRRNNTDDACSGIGVRFSYGTAKEKVFIEDVTAPKRVISFIPNSEDRIVM